MHDIGLTLTAGDRVSTKLQTATLSAAADNDKAQTAGGYLFATADSKDGAASATRDLGKATNTAATLSTNGVVNRFGYGSANDAADVRVSQQGHLAYAPSSEQAFVNQHSQQLAIGNHVCMAASISLHCCVTAAGR